MTELHQSISIKMSGTKLTYFSHLKEAFCGLTVFYPDSRFMCKTQNVSLRWFGE